MIKDWLYTEYKKEIPSDLVEVFNKSNIPENWFDQASLIVHRLAEMPWTTQRSLSEETSMTVAELMTLNSFIRESEDLQNIIIGIQ